MPAPLPATETVPDDRLVRWVTFGLRLVQIALVTWIVVLIPLPILENWLPVKNVGAVLLAVCAAGKALFDTLFYSRYWP
jgi:hypothetical protein